MTMMSHPLKIERECAAVIQTDLVAQTDLVSKDTEAEIMRHSVDLRIHALVMLGNALLAAYCGFRIVGVDCDSVTDDLSPVVMPADILSFCACVTFIAIALACLVESRRFWRKAAAIRSRAEGKRQKNIPTAVDRPVQRRNLERAA